MAKLRKLFFSAFWEALPLDWQRGFYQALEGGAWSGDLVATQNEQEVGVVVYFVHPTLAAKVDRALQE